MKASDGVTQIKKPSLAEELINIARSNTENKEAQQSSCIEITIEQIVIQNAIVRVRA